MIAEEARVMPMKAAFFCVILTTLERFDVSKPHSVTFRLTLF
jgi:hypothetical protein